MNSPSPVYNMNKSEWLNIDHKLLKIIHSRTSGNKSLITIISCANVVCSTFPSMLILQAIHKAYKGEVAN